ncbi:glucose 1-dehydrogenase [Brevibacillus agri]|uniref:glucose 1-dehydrogenase n=1 Tax=Brevibacillus agri TaxID=51101 RepID=UPI003D20194C
MQRLKGKVAIITGAAGGLGAAQAKLFTQEGAKIVATDLREEELDNVVKEINKNGGEAISCRHDVAVEEDWLHVVKKSISEFGKIDVLVNNAGIGTDSGLDDFTIERWDRVMNVNLTGCVMGMKHTVPVMKKAGGGSIINISSISGIVAVNNTNAYTASKGAVRSISKAAAIELAKYSIRVNSVHPGIITTPMSENAMANDQAKSWFQFMTPLPRLGKPEDVAYGVVYLASDESSFVTGTELVIDGGWIAR